MKAWLTKSRPCKHFQDAENTSCSLYFAEPTRRQRPCGCIDFDSNEPITILGFGDVSGMAYHISDVQVKKHLGFTVLPGACIELEILITEKAYK